jgi:hypothetical protein
MSELLRSCQSACLGLGWAPGPTRTPQHSNVDEPPTYSWISVLHPLSSLLIHGNCAGLTRPQIRPAQPYLHMQSPSPADLDPAPAQNSDLAAASCQFQQAWQQQSYSRGLATAHDSAPELIYEGSWCGEEIRTTVMSSAPVGQGPLSIGALIRFGVSHSVSMSRVIKIRSDRGCWPDVIKIGPASALTKDE